MRHLPLAAVLCLAACGGGSTAIPPPACVPGQSIACVGPAGCAGGQACAPDGRNYGACLCHGDLLPDGASPDAGAEAREAAAAPIVPDAAPEAAPDVVADAGADARDAVGDVGAPDVSGKGNLT